MSSQIYQDKIPQDWKVQKIGDFTDCTAGGTPNTQILSYWGGKIPWMSSGELHAKQIYDVAERITKAGLENSSAKIIPKNSVLVGLAGQGKTRGTVAISRIPLCTNQSIAAIFPNDKFCPEYLFYNLENRYDELRSLSAGDGGRGGLNLHIIKNIEISLPQKSEQERIARVLGDFDELISTKFELIDKKRAIKEATAQQLLTPKPHWYTTTLGEILQYEQPTKYIIQGIAISEKGSVPVLTAGKSFILGYTEEEFNCYENFPVIIFDDFTTDSKFVNFRFKVKSSAMKMLKPRKDKISIKFAFILLQSINFIAGDHKRHWISEFSKFKISLPIEKVEQDKIAEILSDMDDEISALQDEVEKLKMIKQSVMSELLSGKIRLKG